MKHRRNIVLAVGIILLGSLMLYSVFTEAYGTHQNIDVHGNESEKDDDADVILDQETTAETEKISGNEALIGVDAITLPAAHTIDTFNVISQLPELPTGCEITAMTMVLNYYGYSVDKMEMAMEYLPTTEAVFYETEAGDIIGPDVNQYFVGDPTNLGYVCGNEVIADAANAYLKDVKSEKSAVALEGTQVEELYRYVAQDIPVVVWVTINMEDREKTSGWFLEDGSYVEWSENDHGAVLIGYDEDTVTIADPIYDIVTCSKEQFEKIYAQRGSQSVILL